MRKDEKNNLNRSSLSHFFPYLHYTHLQCTATSHQQRLLVFLTLLFPLSEAKPEDNEHGAWFITCKRFLIMYWKPMQARLVPASTRSALSTPLSLQAQKQQRQSDILNYKATDKKNNNKKKNTLLAKSPDKSVWSRRLLVFPFAWCRLATSIWQVSWNANEVWAIKAAAQRGRPALMEISTQTSSRSVRETQLRE